MIKNKLMKLIGIDVKASKTVTPALQHNLDEIERLSQSPKWKAHVERLNNDPAYLQRELDLMDNDYNENNS